MSYGETIWEQIRRLARPLKPEPTGITQRLEPLPGIQAVLFDVYGTLLISASGDVGTLLQKDCAEPLSDAFRDAGLTGRLPEAAREGVRRFHKSIHETHTARKAVGVTYPEVDARRLWARVLSDLAKRGFLDRFPTPAETEAVAIGYEMRVNPVWPMPGARDILVRLKQKRIPIGIVSNAQFYTPLIFNALLDMAAGPPDLDPALCVWSWKIGEAKPSSRLFAPVKAELERRGIPAGSAVYIGNDRLNDVATAAEAKFRTVLFAGDRRSLRLRADDLRCQGVEPDRIVTRLSELSALLDPGGKEVSPEC